MSNPIDNTPHYGAPSTKDSHPLEKGRKQQEGTESLTAEFKS
jgi:hypothetical protein